MHTYSLNQMVVVRKPENSDKIYFGWNSDMNKYCGKLFKVVSAVQDASTKQSRYMLEGINYFCFENATLRSADSFYLSFEDVI